MTGDTETFAAAASAASPSMHADGVERTMMSIMGTDALVCYRIDEDEHARRQRAGAGVVSSPDVLELLLSLPVATPVPVASLTGREHSALKRAPRGALTVREGRVTRHAVSPTKVELALVAVRTWQSGLEVAGRFAPFCARAMVLCRHPANLTEMRLQADFYGVGVIVVNDQVTDVLVEPAAFQRLRFTAAGWRFLEEVYRQGQLAVSPRRRLRRVAGG